MERMIYRPHLRHMELPGIRLVSLESPLCWLRQGLMDLVHTWPVSLAFGVLFATFITLLMSPCLYVVGADIRALLRRLLGRSEPSASPQNA